MKTIAVMRRTGLDVAFNENLWKKAVETAQRVGKTLNDTPTMRRLIFESYWNGTQFDLFYSLGFIQNWRRQGNLSFLLSPRAWRSAVTAP